MVRADVFGRGGANGLAVVLAVAVGYSMLHGASRLLASDVLGEVDVVDIVLVQDLRLGYDAFPLQPPLYDWVLWAVVQLTGPHVEAVLLIKYAALVATAAFLYLAAFRALNDKLFALLTVESTALIYQIAWRYHEGFTHQIGAMVAVTATLWCVLRIVQDGGRGRDFVMLGIIAGLGALTMWSYLAFLAALVGACLLAPDFRHRLCDWRALLSAVTAILVASPFLARIAAEPVLLARLLQSVTPTPVLDIDGLLDALRGPLAYLSPLVFILPLLFPGWLRTAWADLTRSRQEPGRPEAAERLSLDAMLLVFAMSLAGAAIFGLKGYGGHHLLPLYLPGVVWLLGVARRSASGHELARSVTRLTRLAIAIAIFAFVARLANMFVMEPACKQCRWGVPYAALGEEMIHRGFAPTGTIVSVDHELAGNLRSVFPMATVVTRGYPDFAPEHSNTSRGTIAFVWGAGISDEFAQRFMQKELGDIQVNTADTVEVGWRHLWRETGWRTSKWRLLIVDRGS